MRCGRIVSNEVPPDTVIAAWIECTDCIAGSPVKSPPIGDIPTRAAMLGYEPEPCPECESMTVVKNSGVLKCNTCGLAAHEEPIQL